MIGGASSPADGDDHAGTATGAPEASWRGLDDHVVEFYFRESRLAESVGEFLLPALDGGQAVLVVATEDHRRRCDEELRAAGVDIDDRRGRGQYLSLDAGETLARFMVDGVPNGSQFEAAVGDLVRRMAGDWGGIRIFGEMVAVLWADGHVGAAVALEDLWNSLQAKDAVELLCAYPTSLFERDDATEPFRQICDQHTRVVPSERTAVEQGAMRAIALLEQRVDAASATRCALERHSRMVVEAQERERRRVAGELHDEIGQTLTGLKLTLEGHDRLSSEAAAVRLAQAQHLTVELLRRVHDLSLDLRPTILDDLGLQPALVSLAQRYGDQTGIHVTLRCSDLGGRLRPEVETAAYRIVQEALTNVARHADVDRAAATCTLESRWLRLEVADNGIGFDVDAVPAGESSGLAGMKERARSTGGRIWVQSIRGRGTTVGAELPLD
jgi:prepilin-type processing-associated H-X9-DG protein